MEYLFQSRLSDTVRDKMWPRYLIEEKLGFSFEESKSIMSTTSNQEGPDLLDTLILQERQERVVEVQAAREQGVSWGQGSAFNDHQVCVGFNAPVFKSPPKYYHVQFGNTTMVCSSIPPRKYGNSEQKTTRAEEWESRSMLKNDCYGNNKARKDARPVFNSPFKQFRVYQGSSPKANLKDGFHNKIY